MIFVTGDTHIPIDIHKLNNDKFPEQKEMTKSDYLIICGDFGGVWNRSAEETYWLKWLNNKPFTTLFVDGNHENFDLLNQYEEGHWMGGKVHRIMASIYHLMRGNIFTIDEQKIFTMGGAASHDKQYRKEGISWWKEELPSESEYQNAIDNLDMHNWDVDVVISHCCPSSIQSQISDYYEKDELTNFFERIVKADCNYAKWFFGHYHDDKEVDDKHICVYDKIIKLI